MVQRYNDGDVDGVMELMDPDAQCEHIYDLPSEFSIKCAVQPLSTWR